MNGFDCELDPDFELHFDRCIERHNSLVRSNLIHLFDFPNSRVHDEKKNLIYHFKKPLSRETIRTGFWFAQFKAKLEGWECILMMHTTLGFNLHMPRNRSSRRGTKPSEISRIHTLHRNRLKKKRKLSLAFSGDFEGHSLFFTMEQRRKGILRVSNNCIRWFEWETHTINSFKQLSATAGRTFGKMIYPIFFQIS